jgi:hypothetical protein
VGIKHVFVSTVADGSTTEHIRPSDWNADHTIDATVVLSSGTATNTPLKFVAGPLNTVSTAGAMEFDGTCFYNTAITGARQVSVGLQAITQTTSRVLTTSTDAQKIFNATTNGAVTVGSGTYFFECQAAITGMTTGASKNVGFGLTGTAAMTQKWWLIARPANNLDVNAATVMVYSQAFSTVITTTTGSSLAYTAQGKIIVTTSGTVIPSIQVLNNNATAATVANASYFNLYPVGSSVVAFVGNWS